MMRKVWQMGVLGVLIFNFLYIAILTNSVYANNLSVSNVSLVDKDIGADTWDIQFDIGWDNSWRTVGAPSPTANWDAAWCFIKVATESGGVWSDYSHATLLQSGNVTPSGCQIVFGETNSEAKGAFLFRDLTNTGDGSVSWQDVELRWDYGALGVSDAETVKVKVFAIEMVYIPEGSFYIGDSIDYCFKWQDGTPGAPQITSVLGNAINVASNDYDDAQIEGVGIRIDGDGGLDSDADGSVDNADFPTGYKAFYIMKYEISQAQYCDFLNALNSTQSANRIVDQYGDQRNYIKLAADGRYGCDANNDAGVWGSANYSQMNESDDGEWIACNYLSYMDGAAYADWAALRPMTELEFEKACRGGEAAVNNEYAWGDATIETVSIALNNDAENVEAPNQGNMNYLNSYGGYPYRVGSHADATSTRSQSGAGYYGAMDLSGSLWERTVTVGNTTGRAYNGSHGDGTLSLQGHANETTWPGLSSGEVTAASGSGLRGGAWLYSETTCRVSTRSVATFTHTSRISNYGVRVVRSDPMA